MPKEAALFQDGELHDAPEAIVQAAYDAYNEIAARCSWRKAMVLDKARRTALKRAVKDYGGQIAFKAALERAAKSPFLLGHVGRTGTHKDWKPDLDFFCQPKSIRKLIEGAYDGEVEQPKRIRMPNVWRPPTANAKPFVQTETLEQRLAASIVSYRKVGNYKRANEIEQKLADMEKRPAVLVPAPEVARVGMPDGPKVIPDPSPKPAPNYARNYSAPPQVTDVVDDYAEIPEGEKYEDD